MRLATMANGANRPAGLGDHRSQTGLSNMATPKGAATGCSGIADTHAIAGHCLKRASLMSVVDATCGVPEGLRDKPGHVSRHAEATSQTRR